MRAIVISPHPDDETLGAYGTVRKMISQGDEVTWLNVTNMKEEYGYSKERIDTRATEIAQVIEKTGYHAFYDLGLEPAGLEKYSKAEIINPIKKVFDEVKPEMVFLPFPDDAHSDHRVVYECALACTKPFRAPYIRRVLCMDILSETNFSTAPFYPNCFVDITPFIEEKIQIASLYKSEIQASPFPRSEEALRAQAVFRGASCYMEYAEAFLIVREVF